MKRIWLPNSRLILVFIAIGLFIVIQTLGIHFLDWQLSTHLAGWLLALGLLLALLDYLRSRLSPPVLIERQVAGNLAVDKWTNVNLQVRHSFQHPTQIHLFDGVPNHVQLNHHPLQLTLQPTQVSSIDYQLKPLLRGPLEIKKTHIEFMSPWKLWKIRYWTGESSSIKVYPDFVAITNYAILATENHTSQIGIKKKQRRGEGLEFHQLREYRSSDSLHQLDWKATSRRQKLISRDYQDERDQQIVLLVDSGRRMRTKDDELNHFDHALNALLLVSYIALRQGDTVSLMSFGGENRWIPPQKGVARIKVLLNGIYDLQASQATADYISAAEILSIRQPKRALIILVTNSRDEDNSELLMAVNLLKKRHLVMVANIREKILDQITTTDIQSFDEALTYLGAQKFLYDRQESQRKLKAAGIHTLDCTANELAVRVANAYLEIKSAGIL